MFRLQTYSYLFAGKVLAFVFSLSIIHQCAPKKAKALGGSGSSSGGSGTSAANTTDPALAISYTQSTVSVTGSNSINHGATTTVCATFKNSSGTALDKPSETMAFALTGGGSSSGTFSTPSYDSNNKRWCTTFTGTAAGSAIQVMATHQLNGSPQSLTSTLPSITVNSLSNVGVSFALQSIRTSDNPFNVDITFDRSITSLDIGDIGVSYTGAGGSIVSLSTISEGTQYRVNIDPNDSEDVTLSFGGGEVVDSLGYANDAASFIARKVTAYFDYSSGVYLQGPSLNFTGVCTSQAGDYFVQLEGSPSSGTCTNNAWSGSGNFALGPHTVSVWQYDGDNNNIATSITIHSDIDPPSITSTINNSNFGDDVKSAFTLSGACSDDLSISSISATVRDSSSTTYGPVSLNCDHSNNGNYSGTIDLSAMTTTGQVLSSYTITDSSGRTYTLSDVPSGTYYPPPGISNLTSDYTCLGQYCGSSTFAINYSGNCVSSQRQELYWRITDGSDNTLNGNANSNSNCSSGSFSVGFSTGDSWFNSISDGTYTFKIQQCDFSNNDNCSEQTRDIILNRENTCTASGSPYDSPSPNIDECVQNVYTYENYTCEDGSSGTNTLSGPFTSCNCSSSGSSSSYGNYNSDYSNQTCAVDRTDESYTMVANWDSSGCIANYNNTNTVETFGCGQTVGGYGPCAASGCTGDVSSLAEVYVPNGTCVGQYCTSSTDHLAFSGSCSSINSNLKEYLLDASNNEIWVHDISCSSNSFGANSHYANGNFNLPNGSYTYQVKQCTDYFNGVGCDYENYSFDIAHTAGSVSLSETSGGYSCVGQNCAGGAADQLTFSGTCESDANSTVTISVILPDTSIAWSDTTSCSSDAFSISHSISGSVDGRLNYSNNTGYAYKVEQCALNTGNGCNSQTWTFEINN